MSTHFEDSILQAMYLDSELESIMIHSVNIYKMIETHFMPISYFDTFVAFMIYNQRCLVLNLMAV